MSCDLSDDSDPMQAHLPVRPVQRDPTLAQPVRGHHSRETFLISRDRLEKD